MDVNVGERCGDQMGSLLTPNGMLMLINNVPASLNFELELYGICIT